jgi:hypothetical protein
MREGRPTFYAPQLSFLSRIATSVSFYSVFQLAMEEENVTESVKKNIAAVDAFISAAFSTSGERSKFRVNLFSYFRSVGLPIPSLDELARQKDSFWSENIKCVDFQVPVVISVLGSMTSALPHGHSSQRIDSSSANLVSTTGYESFLLLGISIIRIICMCNLATDMPLYYVRMTCLIHAWLQAHRGKCQGRCMGKDI